MVEITEDTGRIWPALNSMRTRSAGAALHKGHVGLLACSGMLNGFFGEGEMRHIAHWRSVKYVHEFNEEGEAEGETIIGKRELFSHELTLLLAIAQDGSEGRQVDAVGLEVEDVDAGYRPP